MPESTKPGSSPIEIDVSQEDFAAMTNLARTTAGAVLRRFEASGYLKVSYRRVRILAPDALRAMLEGARLERNRITDVRPGIRRITET